MSGFLQQIRTAAHSFRTVCNFIAIAYLQMVKLNGMPAHLYAPAAPIDLDVTRHVC